MKTPTRTQVSMLLALSGASLALAQEPQPPQLSFGRLPIDRPFEQTVEFDNPLDRELTIDSIQLTPPLVATGWTKKIPPGGRGGFTFRLGEPREAGAFEGVIIVRFATDAVDQLVFEIDGTLVPPIEVVPYPAIFLVTRRGTPKEATVEIVNHRDRALRLGELPPADERRSLRLETVDAGQRYRLVARMSGEGAAGRRSENISLPVGEGEEPLTVQLNTLLNERVYAFPDEVSFGTLPLGQVRDSGTAAGLAQTVMVFRKEQPGLEVRASSSLPFVRVVAERGEAGDRWQLTLSLDPAATPAGEIWGMLVVETNDPEFPLLEVPIVGRVTGGG